MDQHVARRAANVDDAREPRKVVGRGDSRRLASMDAHHRLAEDRCFLRMLREVVEQRFAKGLLETGFARLERMKNVIV
jgi:hypothetical protein